MLNAMINNEINELEMNFVTNENLDICEERSEDLSSLSWHSSDSEPSLLAATPVNHSAVLPQPKISLLYSASHRWKGRCKKT